MFRVWRLAFGVSRSLVRKSLIEFLQHSYEEVGGGYFKSSKLIEQLFYKKASSLDNAKR